jgi:hypothetical protein
MNSNLAFNFNAEECTEENPANDNFELKPVEEKKTLFPEAEAVNLLRDEEGVPKVDKFMLIVNKDNHEQEFTVVTKGYKIIQHDDMYKAVKESIDSMKLNYNIIPVIMNEGGRLRVYCDFKDIHLTIGTEEITLRAIYDNSYNCTTGVRLEICGYSGNKSLFAGEVGKYYHKHTKGLQVSELISGLQKGIKIFENHYAEVFSKMFSKNISETECVTLIDKWIEDKLIPVKYLEMMKEVIVNNGYAEISKHETISNYWLFYNVACEVLSTQVKSVDTQRNHINTMFQAISTEIK